MVAETAAVAEADPPPTAGPRSLFRRAVLPPVKVALALAIAGFLVYDIVQQWSQVQQTWLGMAWQSVALSFGAAIAGMLASVMAWRASLKDLEYEVSYLAAARINFIGALGKYLPGTVWAYVLQMEFGRRAGLPRTRALLASLIAVSLAMTTGLVLGTLALPSLVADAHSSVPYGNSIKYTLYIFAILAPVALLCAIPGVLTRLVQLLLRILRRPPLTHRLSWVGVLRVLGWTTVTWFCFGLHLWLLASTQAAPGSLGLFRLIGAFAVAVTVGLFAVFAPSGLGVREAVLVAALSPLFGPDDGVGVALGIAVASRMLFIVADLFTAGVTALVDVAVKRARPRAEARTGA